MIKIYKFDDFNKSDAWLLFRVNIFAIEEPVDVYTLMDLPSGYVLGNEIASEELSQKQLSQLLSVGLKQKGKLPNRLLIASGDPAEPLLRESAKKLKVNFESGPVESFEALTASVNKTFTNYFSSQSSLSFEEENLDEDFNNVMRFLPDSYDFCSCASGKKYKFCCKKIFHEITEAMVAAEDGRVKEAFDWIAKAEKIVGKTAELLCRKSIVYSFYDPEKSEKLLSECLEMNPNHPRAHYIRALWFRKTGDFGGAVLACETAIKNYPATDKYHLNEAYNNLGVLFHDMGKPAKAKSAWEQALHYMPSDKLTRQNLKLLENDFSCKT